MASQNSLNVFSKTGLKWFSPNMGQVGPGWEMESESVRAWVGPGHTQLYCLEDVRKGGLADGRAARGAWILPGLQPINSVILGRSLNFSSDQCPCL